MALRRGRRDESGAAAVEFALILPIFLILLFGIVDFGYMINRGSIINNAARDAVREASLGATEAQVRARVNTDLSTLSGVTTRVSCKLPSGAACSNFDNDGASGGTAVVTIEYQHEMLTPVGMFFPGGFDLTRKAEMRIE